jgi:hypothetical protein
MSIFICWSICISQPYYTVTFAYEFHPKQRELGVGLGSGQQHLVLVDITSITSKDNRLTVPSQFLDREQVSRSLGNEEDIIQDHGGGRTIINAT